MFRSRLTMIAAVTMITCAAPVFAAGHPQNINKHQAAQQHRIAQGIESGTLTPKETATLERQEARINALEAKDRQSGGKLGPNERAELNGLLNLESHRIYKQKHDGQGK